MLYSFDGNIITAKSSDEVISRLKETTSSDDIDDKLFMLYMSDSFEVDYGVEIDYKNSKMFVDECIKYGIIHIVQMH